MEGKVFHDSVMKISISKIKFWMQEHTHAKLKWIQLPRKVFITRKPPRNVNLLQLPSTAFHSLRESQSQLLPSTFL